MSILDSMTPDAYALSTNELMQSDGRCPVLYINGIRAGQNYYSRETVESLIASLTKEHEQRMAEAGEGVVVTFNWQTPIKIEVNGVVLYAADMSPKPYWEVAWASGWSGEYATKEEAEQDCVSVCGFVRSTREINPDDAGYKDPRFLNITEVRYPLPPSPAVAVAMMGECRKQVLLEAELYLINLSSRYIPAALELRRMTESTKGEKE